jgi:hypothetical protein
MDGVDFICNAAQDTGVGATANSGAGSPIEGKSLPMHDLQLSASGRSPRVLFLSSEAYPVARTGGLSDVCGALPKTLARLGVDVRVMIPGYRMIYKPPRGRRLPPDHGPDAEPRITGTAL